jgi:hypothetical protein
MSIFDKVPNDVFFRLTRNPQIGWSASMIWYDDAYKCCRLLGYGKTPEDATLDVLSQQEIK